MRILIDKIRECSANSKRISRINVHELPKNVQFEIYKKKNEQYEKKIFFEKLNKEMEKIENN